MHIYGDLQRRMSNRRSLQEKIQRQVDMILALAMLCTLIVGTTMITIRSQKTFNHNMWRPNVDLELTSALKHVTVNCTAEVHYGSYGFGSFNTYISWNNLIDPMAVIAGMARSNIILAFVVLFFAYVNRFLVAWNVYFIRYRNYVFRKSTLTVVELFIALVGVATVADVEREAAPVRQYLRACGVTATRTMPFGCPMTFLYVFYGIEFAGFIINGVQLAINGFRKPPKAVVDEWEAEQFELIKPKEEIDDRKTQIIVAEDGTALGRVHPGEIEAIRARQQSLQQNVSSGGEKLASTSSPFTAQQMYANKITRTPNRSRANSGGNLASISNASLQTPAVAFAPTQPNFSAAAAAQPMTPNGTHRVVDRTGATPQHKNNNNNNNNSSAAAAPPSFVNRNPNANFIGGPFDPVLLSQQRLSPPLQAAAGPNSGQRQLFEVNNRGGGYGVQHGFAGNNTIYEN